MQALILLTVFLFGPSYLALLAALYLARRFVPEARVLYEISETILVVPAATLALAAAVVIAQVIR